MMSSSNESVPGQYQKLCRKYQALGENLKENIDNASDDEEKLESVRYVVLKSNELYTWVQGIREAVLDIDILKSCSSCVKTNAELHQTGSQVFSPEQFAIKFREYMSVGQTGPIDNAVWERFGAAVCGIFRLTHGTEAMAIGLEAVTFPERMTAREKPRQQKDPTVPKNSPALVTEKSGDDIQTEEIQRIFQILQRKFRENKRQPLCYYSFILNPDSFIKSVENMFHASFLFKEGKAKLILQEDIPYILPLTSRSDLQEDLPANQFIMSIDKMMWQDLVSAFNVTCSTIPPRGNE